MVRKDESPFNEREQDLLKRVKRDLATVSAEYMVSARTEGEKMAITMAVLHYSRQMLDSDLPDRLTQWINTR